MRAIYDLQRIMNSYYDSQKMFDSTNTGIITLWDSKKADKDFSELVIEFEDNFTKVSKMFIEKFLIGKTIKSVVGDVMINNKSRGKLADRMRPNKALAIARIPEILISGKVIKFEPLNKERTDSFIGFYVIEKRLTFDGFVLNATMKVGVRDDRKNIAYYLASNKEKTKTFDSFHTPNFVCKTHYSATRSHSFGSEVIKPQFDRLGNTTMPELIVLLDTLAVT